MMLESDSDSQEYISRKEMRNELKRTRGEENISGTTISSGYDPVMKKRRRTCALYNRNSIATCATVKCIYKNTLFENDSRESVRFVEAPLPLSVSRFSFGSCVFNKKVRTNNQRHKNMDLLGQARTQIFNLNGPEKDTTQVIITSPDGAKKQIVLRKMVLMHVRETPNCAAYSPANGEENKQRILEGPSGATSCDDFNQYSDCGDANIMYPATSIDHLQVGSFRNLTNPWMNTLSRNIDQSVRSSQVPSSVFANSTKQSTSENKPPPFHSTSKAVIPQSNGKSSQLITFKDIQGPSETIIGVQSTLFSQKNDQSLQVFPSCS